jgi:hypothetical protein
MIIQLKNQNAPFVIFVYCMNYYINLIVQTFFKLGTMRKIEWKCNKKNLCIILSYLKNNHSFFEWVDIV